MICLFENPRKHLYVEMNDDTNDIVITTRKLECNRKMKK